MCIRICLCNYIYIEPNMNKPMRLPTVFTIYIYDKCMMYICIGLNWGIHVFKSVTRLIYKCDMTHIWVWHHSFITRLISLDSLCHALEAYVSRKSNPFTDALALTAMSTISQCLRTYVNVHVSLRLSGCVWSCWYV